MSTSNLHIKLIFTLTLFFSFSTVFLGQENNTTPSPTPTPEEVLKINTDLIQTGVTVFDKKGQFVRDLKSEDFELRVDGKPVPFSFFQYVTSNGGQQSGKNETKGANPLPDAIGRTIIFFVDDVHLSIETHKRTRDMLRKFINTDMADNDQVVIVCTTGKIGFLQQFTNDKVLLLAATEKLGFNQEFSAGDRSSPPMSEYEAALIDRGDGDVLNYFIEETIKAYNMTGPGARSQAQGMVVARMRAVLSKSDGINEGTYTSLEQVLRTSGQFPGRKVVFFLSDGFILNQSSSSATYRLRRITDAAARSNSVIYSVDTKGLEGFNADGGELAYRTAAGKRVESLDGLNVLANDTGGRMFTNTNDLKAPIVKGLNEASVYYLIAWEPDINGNSKPGDIRRIEVSVKGRSDLQVRMQNGYLTAGSKTANPIAETKNTKTPVEPSTAKNDKAPVTPTNNPAKPVASRESQELVTELNSQVRSRALPVSVVANYIDTPADGALLATTLQISGNGVDFTNEGDKAKASIDILGAIYNAEGKREETFSHNLATEGPASKEAQFDRPNIYYNHKLKLKPGLYQVRVAARDSKTGSVGSAVQWIEIPDLSSKTLALSSLLLSERMKEDKPQNASSIAAGETKTTISVDKKFSRSSYLRYTIFIYNTAAGKSGDSNPNLTAQLQISRNNQLVADLPASQIITTGQDPARLNYIAEIPLESLPAGRYAMQLTINDQNAKKKVVQYSNFEIY